jgi:osmotically inducible protein OsmC
MAIAQRRAQTIWTGTTARGSGRLQVDSGAFPDLPLTFAARTGQAEGKTSPEELIAAAHSACYAMALSARLTQAGTPPDELTVEAICTLDRLDEAYLITTIELTVRGRVPGAAAAAFTRAAMDAKESCPVSKALRGNVELRLDAALVE